MKIKLLCGLLMLLTVTSVQAQEPGSDDNAVRFLVLANRESPLSSVVPGRIDKVNVQLGDTVKKGEQLAELDCSDLTARRAAAQAEYRAAQLRYEAKAKLQGLQSAAALEVGLAAADVNRTKGQMGIFDAQLAQCKFVAPFDGRVARIYVREGQGVSAGGQVIDLVASGTLKARLNVPSAWIVWLKTGSTLNALVAETGQHYPLTVTHISGRVDAVSQTIEIETTFSPEVKDLLPGMSGQAVPVCPADKADCAGKGTTSS
ncbi:MAG: efflux RND transporter periplasmic adaptor subunit [Scandinavium sp.]|uniref:efflux RND transporter periplasmic adaptor subunit n=1 Tax=Scandinavium sp. TaxID=2830653 RepID=UPI003F3228CF